MSLLTPTEFRNLPMGGDVSTLGDADLWGYSDRALAKIEDYLGTPLHFTLVIDEESPVMDPFLTVFPTKAPLRGVQEFNLLVSASGGSRYQRAVRTQSVEVTRPGRPPKIFGDVKIDRTVGSMQIISFAALMGWPWMRLAQSAGTVVYTYTVGYDDDSDMTVYDDVVQTVTGTQTFTVTTGYGQYLLLNVPVTINGIDAAVSSITGDTVVLAAPYTGLAPGMTITQGDGVSLPPPRWLKEVIRDVMWHDINVSTAASIGATTMNVQVGEIRYSMPASQMGQLNAIPQSVKDELDTHFGTLSMEIA